MTGGATLFLELKGELLELFRRGVGEPLAEETFNDLALRVFRFQVEANPAYGAFVERRLQGASPPERWEEIPHLPTRAFKAAPLVAGDPNAAEAVFRTSGTTGGLEERGTHHVLSLELYRGALTPNFRAHLLPDGRTLPTLSLLPSPEEAPHSSLSYMVGAMAGEGSGFFFHPTNGIRVAPFQQALERAQEVGDPILLVGTAFSFLTWLEMVREKEWRFHLPEGSRIMETGGYKGRTNVLSKDALYESISNHFGVPQRRIVNEYGMTELLSQFYEPVLTGGMEGGDILPSQRLHRGPPWVRSRVLRPLTLEAADPGEVGILAHLDLANLGSVAAVLTEDLAHTVPGGFVLRGRSVGAEPRGCSLAMEAFLEGLEGDDHGF